MPEPNLPTLRLYEDPDDLINSKPNQLNIAGIRQQKFELPDTVRRNLVSTYGLRVQTANTIIVRNQLIKSANENSVYFS